MPPSKKKTGTTRKRAPAAGGSLEQRIGAAMQGLELSEQQRLSNAFVKNSPKKLSDLPADAQALLKTAEQRLKTRAKRPS